MRLTIMKNPFIKMTPKNFEFFVARYYEKIGYKTKVIGGAGDNGVDILAEDEREILYIQCKKYQIDNKVGVETVQIAAGTLSLYSSNQNKNKRAVIVTSSYFTEQAKKSAKLSYDCNIELREYDESLNMYRALNHKSNIVEIKVTLDCIEKILTPLCRVITMSNGLISIDDENILKKDLKSINSELKLIDEFRQKYSNIAINNAPTRIKRKKYNSSFKRRYAY